MENRIRFNHNANTIDGAKEYLNSKSKQLLKFGFNLFQLDIKQYGVIALFIKDGETFQSTYVLEQFRNKGYYQKDINHVIITTPDCNIEDYLINKGIEYIVVNVNEYPEYELISDYYRGNRATRSNVEFMNHIDEGLYVLKHLGASMTAQRAYCLHPMLQGDSDLVENVNKFKHIDSEVLILAMEYRSVANEYLSSRIIDRLSDIRTSPLMDVNDMLVADKIQNKKDFDLYHLNMHPRSAILSEYFDNWITRLGAWETYKNCIDIIK